MGSGHREVSSLPNLPLCWTPGVARTGSSMETKEFSPHPVAVLTVSDPHPPGETGDGSAETNWHRKMSQSLAWLWAECLFLRLPCVMTLVLK